MSFGSRLRGLRESKNISRQELIDKFGITYSSYSKYETDERSPDKELIVEFAQFFGVSTDYLLGVERYYTIPDDDMVSRDELMHEVSPEYKTKLSQTDLEVIELWRKKGQDKISIRELEKIIDFYIDLKE